MSSIFEDLMLQNSTVSNPIDLTESVSKKKTESVKKFNLSKFKVESRRVLESENFDELDKQFAVDPENSEDSEVVLVIDPEVNADEELPEDAAEQAIGDYVYKCPVCGSNYLCNCDGSMEESVEVDENGVPTECPICGDDADQILVGEIAPVEGAGEEKKELDPVEPEDAEDNEEKLGTEEKEEEPEVQEESLKLEESPKEEIQESVDVHVADNGATTVVTAEANTDNVPAEEPTPVDPDVCPVCANDPCTCGDLDFDECRFESLVNEHLDSTFKGSPKIKVESIKIKGDNLSIAYTLSLGSKTSKGNLHCEGFDINKKIQRIILKDKGIITESVGHESKFEARAMIRDGKLKIF